MSDRTFGRRDLVKTASALAMGLAAARAQAADAGAAVAVAGPRPELADVDGALAEVAKARASLKTLAGPFTQERTIGLLASKIRSQGSLVLVRPDRLRWELAPPDEVVYWVGPDGLAYKSARASGRMPAASGKLAAALEDIRILLGGDLAKLRSRYDLSLLARGPEGITFDAVPRQGTDAKLQRLQFGVGADRVRPTRATLVESARDKTDIVFGALDRDVPVDPARVRPPF